jgi:hypothetical protein
LLYVVGNELEYKKIKGVVMKKIIKIIIFAVVLSHRLVAQETPVAELQGGLSENEQMNALRQIGVLNEQMKQLVKEIVQCKNRMEKISTLSLFWGQRPKMGNEVEYSNLAKKVAENKEKLELLNQSYLKLGRITGHTFDSSWNFITDAIKKKAQSYYDSMKNYLGYK